MPRNRQKERMPATIWFRVRVETNVPIARKKVEGGGGQELSHHHLEVTQRGGREELDRALPLLLGEESHR
jgi:hypothetical protein